MLSFVRAHKRTADRHGGGTMRGITRAATGDRRAKCCTLLAVAFSTGCASIGVLPGQVNDRPLRSVEEEKVQPDGAHVGLTQAGTELSMVVSHSCELFESPVVERTTRTESTNNSAALDWALFGTGVAAAGLGMYTTFDSSGVYGTSTNSRTYNPIGPTGAAVIGIGSIALGVALLVIPVVDVVRANRETVERAEVTTQGKVIRRDFACTLAPFNHAAVSGRLGDKAFALGTANADGKLDVDLDSAIDPQWAVPTPPARLRIVAEGIAAGEADLAPLFQVREMRAWEQSSPDRCLAPKTADGCDLVKLFIARYPAGPHAADARRVLDDSSPQIHRLADDADWRSHADDVQNCASKKLDDPAEVEGACSGVQSYITSFAGGQHSAEAQTVITKGSARVTALRAAAERRQKAEEAEEARKAAAEAALRKAQVEEDCKNKCFVICSRTLDPMLCLAGCGPRCIKQEMGE